MKCFDGTDHRIRGRAVSQAVPARQRAGRHRPDAAPCRQDPRLRGRWLLRMPWLAAPCDCPDREPTKDLVRRDAKIAILPGDGIGTEIVAERSRCWTCWTRGLEMEQAPVGGAAYEAHGHPLPAVDAEIARGRPTPLFGAGRRPVRQAERRCDRSRRSSVCAGSWACSPTCARDLLRAVGGGVRALKPELVAGLDLMIIRELTGDIYFGEPRGVHVARRRLRGAPTGLRHDALHRGREIERIATSRSRPRATRQATLTRSTRPTCWKTFQFWKDVVTVGPSPHYPGRRARPPVRRQRGDAIGRAPARRSTWWSPATCSATSCPTRRRC